MAPADSTVGVSHVEGWARVWPALAPRLTRLRHLNLWLDHEESKPWYLVNERAVLSPFLAQVPNTKAQVSICLPNLHPKHENPERHFSMASPLPQAVNITRRIRQRHLYNECTGSVTYVEDFPVLFILVELTDSDGYREEGQCISRDMAEQMEREMYERGEDPKELVEDVMRVMAPCGFINI